jgi:hypothetical protein
MRFVTPELATILDAGEYQKWFEADLFYGRERRIQALPIINPDLRWNAASLVQGSGTAAVVWTDDFATSLSPVAADDLLAPFGPTLAFTLRIRSGRSEHRIPLGWFRIVDVPSARDQESVFRGRPITTGSLIELTLQDLMVVPKRNRFSLPQTATDLSSVYTEMGRLTGLPITRTIPDKPITRKVVYDGDHLTPVYELAKLLDGVPHMMSDGTLSVRPKAWTPPIARYVCGPGGTISSIGSGMNSEGVYNKIVVRTTGTDARVLYETEVTDGPLRTRNPDGSPAPAGTVPYFLESEYVTTAPQAKEWADRELPRASMLAGTQVPVVMQFDPRLEAGDVIEIVSPTRTWLCRVNEISLTGSAEVTVMVEVAGG